MMDIDRLGLEKVDREILSVIIDRHSGGPVGLGAIANIIGANKKIIESIYEPYLVKIGLIERTRSGRIVTELGYRHMNRVYKK